MPRLTVAQTGGENVSAFLDMIAVSEIGVEMLAESDDGYNVLVGSTIEKPLLFSSYADHPNIYNKEMDSDAAGRYQIMAHWWPAYKKILKLPDFGPVSQDWYALRQICEQHAFDLIKHGQIVLAMLRVSNIWASLPGSQYNQHTNSKDYLIAAYEQAGGILK